MHAVLKKFTELFGFFFMQGNSELETHLKIYINNGKIGGIFKQRRVHMQCFIYKSLKKEALYLYIDKRDDFSAVPDALLQSLGRLNFVMELQLDPQRKLAKEDVKKVIESLQNKGFFIQLPPTILPLNTNKTTNLLH